MHFSDKAVVITGAAGGLGTAFTRRFLAEGARVCATETAAGPLGRLSTPPAASFPPGLIDRVAAKGAIKRPEVADDVVGPAVFFASDDAAFVTAQSLSVDGGRHFL
jgi:NAD(P)-dependent dehydrogenase (short-subunit alcohol dehydrogenase family)